MKRSAIIRIEGGIFSPDLLESLAHGDLQGQKPSDFGYKNETEMLNHLALLYSDARALYQQFRHAHEQLPDDQSDTTLTRQRWVIPLLRLLEYQPTYNPEAYTVDQSRYRISHRADESPESPPIHIVGRRQSLDRVDPTAQPRRAPHALMQEFLNRTDHLWGIATNGSTLRLLRDSTYLRKLAYIEFDLDALFGEPQFEQFLLFYRLLHRSRLPRRFDDASRCLLEAYYRHSEQQSGRVRERLREGVERALVQLANAFLQHPDNPPLKQGALPDPRDLHQQLLRLVYRMLFLLVGEERGLISDSRLYQQHYSVSRLRPLTQRYAPLRHPRRPLVQPVRPLGVPAQARTRALPAVGPAQRATVRTRRARTVASDQPRPARRAAPPVLLRRPRRPRRTRGQLRRTRCRRVRLRVREPARLEASDRHECAAPAAL
jgi:hypothetical protein